MAFIHGGLYAAQPPKKEAFILRQAYIQGGAFIQGGGLLYKTLRYVHCDTEFLKTSNVGWLNNVSPIGLPQKSWEWQVK